MNVIITKDWYNPDTGSKIKAGQMVDLLEWKVNELVKDGYATIPGNTEIKDTTKEKDFEFEEIQEPKKKKSYF